MARREAILNLNNENRMASSGLEYPACSSFHFGFDVDAHFLQVGKSNERYRG
jgi:hypothetical protein